MTQKSSWLPFLGRRSFVIDRSFQFRHTAKLLTICALGSAVFGGSLALAFLRIRSSTPDASVPMVVVGILTVTCALFVTGVVVLGLTLTHRISGPMFVIGRVLDAVAVGALPTLRPLRKNDEFQWLYRRLEAALDYLHGKEK